MERRRVFTFALVLLLALTICQVSAWSVHIRYRRIPGFHVIRRLPRSMIAGSTYEMEVRFRNPRRETAIMNVTLEIIEEQTVVGFGEFFITGTLYAWETPPPKDYYDDLIFDEVNGGIFNSTGIVRGKTHNYLTIKISSVPNLMPGTYTFTLTVTLQFED